MPEKTTRNKKILLLTAGIVVVILLVYGLKTFHTNSGTSDNGNYSEGTDLLTGNTMSLADSDTAISAIMNAAVTWSGDAKLISCSGSATVTVNTGVYGYQNGKFANWNCFVYSASKSQDTTVSWSSGTTETKTAHITYGGANGSDADISARKYFSLANFISSDNAYSTVVSNGFDTTNDYPGFSFGSYSAREAYGERAVWEIHEYKISAPDTEVRTYYVDAVTNQLLSVNNAD